MSSQDKRFRQAYYDNLQVSKDKDRNFSFTYSFFYILKISFILILVFYFLKLGFADTEETILPFSALLDYLKNCPNFYGNIISFLKNYTILSNVQIELLPGLSSFINAIKNVYNVLLLLCGTIISGIGYMFYIITFPFISF